jgi:carotenoid cleavage dioxygenase-like enzyme
MKVPVNKVYFSPPEEEIIESLQEIYGITLLEACEQVIIQKRELAFMHRGRGNYELERTILKELGEWTDEREAEFEARPKVDDIEKEIILLS